MQKKFILIRHAESKHNLMKKEMEKINPNFKKSEQYKKFRFNEEYLDPQDIIIPQISKLCNLIKK